MEELAQEVSVSNLPHGIRQWMRITKPTTQDGYVEVVEDEEKWEQPRRRINRPPNQEYLDYRKEAGWQLKVRRNVGRAERVRPSGQQTRRPSSKSKTDDPRQAMGISKGRHREPGGVSDTGGWVISPESVLAFTEEVSTGQRFVRT